MAISFSLNSIENKITHYFTSRDVCFFFFVLFCLSSSVCLKFSSSLFGLVFRAIIQRALLHAHEPCIPVCINYDRVILLFFLLLLYHYLIYSRKNPLLMRITIIEHTFNRVAILKHTVHSVTACEQTSHMKEMTRKRKTTFGNCCLCTTRNSDIENHWRLFISCWLPFQFFFSARSPATTWNDNENHAVQAKNKEHKTKIRITCKNGE